MSDGDVDPGRSFFSPDGKFIFLQNKSCGSKASWTVLEKGSNGGWQTTEERDLFKGKNIFFSPDNNSELIAVDEVYENNPVMIDIHTLDDAGQWKKSETIPLTLPDFTEVQCYKPDNNQIILALEVPLVVEDDYEPSDLAEQPVELSTLQIERDGAGLWHQKKRNNIAGIPCGQSPDALVRMTRANDWDGKEATTIITLFDLTTQTQQEIKFPYHLGDPVFYHSCSHPRSIAVHMYDSLAKSDVVEVFRQGGNGEWSPACKIQPDGHSFKTLSFNADGQLLASLSSDNVVRVWGEISKGHLEEKGSFKAFDNPNSLCFTPDSRYVLVESSACSNLWEILPDTGCAYVTADEDDMSSDEQ